LKQQTITRLRRLAVAVILTLTHCGVQAQTGMPEVSMPATDSIVALVDSIYTATQLDSLVQMTDSTLTEGTSIVLNDLASEVSKKTRRDWSTWKPNPQRALWLALVIPGGGQIYNRKYWKLPIVYGGFVGCIYALNWNNNMYKDYAQAYLDIMDDDPNTASYNKFLHLGRQITPQNEERYKQIFKSRKDKYRRWRDLSFFVMLGIYAISVIDAYVDAELSDFDISKDLSLKVRPAVMNNKQSSNPLYATSLGVNCSLNF
jgi:hypothetical protein